MPRGRTVPQRPGALVLRALYQIILCLVVAEVSPEAGFSQESDDDLARQAAEAITPALHRRARHESPRQVITHHTRPAIGSIRAATADRVGTAVAGTSTRPVGQRAPPLT